MRAEMGANWSLDSRLAMHVMVTPLQRDHWRRACKVLALLLALTAIFLAWIAFGTDWDLLLADRYFDATAKAFPLRHAWATEVLNHVILKRVFVAIALLFLGAVLWDLMSPRRWTWLQRFRMRIVALSALIVPTVIGVLKQQSASHCPWDLERYGGTEPYVRLFDYLPAGIGPGNCMPAGHASSALWMISLAVFFIPLRLRQAALVLAGFLGMGICVGWMQQLRGAHFLTHTLWSAWIALFTVYLIVLSMDCWPRRQAAARTSSPTRLGQRK